MSDTEHTYMVMDTKAEAIRAAKELQADGWEVYPINEPLAGRAGFNCVQVYQENGTFLQRSRIITWNLYHDELVPIVIDCDGEATLFGFVFQHARHDTFGFFKYPVDEDLGFVCYCQAHSGRSMVLRIPNELELDEAACEFLWQYQMELEE